MSTQVSCQKDTRQWPRLGSNPDCTGERDSHDFSPSIRHKRILNSLLTLFDVVKFTAYYSTKRNLSFVKFIIRINIWRYWFLWEEENQRTRRKTFRARRQTTTTGLDPYMALVVAERSLPTGLWEQHIEQLKYTRVDIFQSFILQLTTLKWITHTVML